VSASQTPGQVNISRLISFEMNTRSSNHLHSISFYIDLPVCQCLNTMHFLPFLASLAMAPMTLGAPSFEFSPSTLSKRCTNSATDRSCWGDYDITTNYYDEGPDTGVVREYWFEITNTTAAPDGIERLILSINGTVPGPTIIADWGDTVGELTCSELLFTLSILLTSL
jgi:hypothetical protein